jgi:hypothetical protein
LIQDSLGTADTWPGYVQQAFTSNSLTYTDRLKILTFLWVNGYRDLRDWYEIIQRIKGQLSKTSITEIKNLWDYFSKDDVQHRYFSYCTKHKRLEFLNNKPKNMK